MQKIYVHGEGIRETKLVELPQESKKGDVIAALKSGVQFTNEEEVYLFIDDEEAPLEGQHPRLKPKQHVHIHRCKKVMVTVSYNGQKTLQVPPNTKVSKLVRLAAAAFSVTEEDAADLILKLGGDTLESTSRIGSYVTPGTCAVSLSLTPNAQVKG